MQNEKVDPRPDFISDPEKLAAIPAAERLRLAEQYILWAAALLSVPVDNEKEERQIVAKAHDRKTSEILLTEKETARILHVTPHGLQKWRADGKGPRYIKTGRKFLRYRQSDIDQFLKESTIGRD